MLILVADDVADVRDTMRILLEMLGHEVVLACNGLQAVQIASQRPLDVILMDVSMPIMDGFTATRHLRDLGDTSHVPIVVVSSYMNDDISREKAFAAGCDECYPKPVDLATLGES